MGYVLLGAKICGVKCIDNPIEIQFENKTVTSDIFQKSHIKAIYGTNGEGKSSIIHAMNLYYHSVMDDDYLVFESKNSNLKEMINKKLKKAFVDLYFAVPSLGNEKIIILHHVIHYEIKNDNVVISQESLSGVVGNKWGDEKNERLIFSTKDGKLEYLDEYLKPLEEKVKDNSYNLLDKSSALMYFVECINDKDNFHLHKDGDALFRVIINTLLFVLSINIYIDDNDYHQLSVKQIKQIANRAQSFVNSDLPVDYGFAIDYEIDEVEKKDFKDYEKEIKKVEGFLKIFKPDLKDIYLDKTPKGDTYICKKILRYKNGNEVSSEYESNGIKKLMKLYPCLNAMSEEEIVFIDEFDSNLHDVYLCKLIEYFDYYTRGQIVFTTHNLGPMEVLGESKKKHTIDFINHSKISSWKKNGNYSVVNVYRCGAIPNCPFTIDSADFVRVFGV